MRFRCPECGCPVTRGPSGLEYGHARYPHESAREGVRRCSRRPAAVDPSRSDPFAGGGSA